MLQLNNTEMKIMTTNMLKSLQIVKPEIKRITGNNKVYNIINLVTNYNDKLSKWDANVFQNNYKVNDSMYKTAKEQGLNMGEEWAKKIIEEYKKNH